MNDRSKAIYERYCSGMDYRSIGKEYGVTGERIRQIIKKYENETDSLKVPVDMLTQSMSLISDSTKYLLGNVSDETLLKLNKIYTDLNNLITDIRNSESITESSENKSDRKTLLS